MQFPEKQHVKRWHFLTLANHGSELVDSYVVGVETKWKKLDRGLWNYHKVYHAVELGSSSELAD